MTFPDKLIDLSHWLELTKDNLQISETFAEMIFHHGFVHCDPHAANMMLRVKPGKVFFPSVQLTIT